MKLINILCLIIILLTLLSCSGDDPIDNDTIPPSNPKLIAHRGDVGDPPMIVNNQPVAITDENNGIDADPVGNWINLRWEPLIDTDLSHIKVFRFSESDPEPDSLATIPASDNGFQDRDGSLVEREWYSYFIELYDSSGNYSTSDTVSYALLAKSNLYTPEEGATVSPLGLKLRWYKGSSYATRFRVLVWIDATNELKWFSDFYLATEDDPLEVNFPVLSPAIPSGTALRWRVDAFDDSDIHSSSMGSESHERIFYLE